MGRATASSVVTVHLIIQLSEDSLWLYKTETLFLHWFWFHMQISHL